MNWKHSKGEAMKQALSNALGSAVAIATSRLNKLGASDDATLMGFVSFAQDWAVKSSLRYDVALASAGCVEAFIAQELSGRGFGIKLCNAFDDGSLCFIVGHELKGRLNDDARRIIKDITGQNYTHGEDFIRDVFSGRIMA